MDTRSPRFELRGRSPLDGFGDQPGDGRTALVKTTPFPGGAPAFRDSAGSVHGPAIPSPSGAVAVAAGSDGKADRAGDAFPSVVKTRVRRGRVSNRRVTVGAPFSACEPPGAEAARGEQSLGAAHGSA
jgi:hypothetical protein